MDSKIPFQSRVQSIGREMAPKTKRVKVLTEKVHHSGKGTRARLNTVAEKSFFGSRVSK